MTVFEWLQSAKKEYVQEFIWEVYHCGNVDGRHHAEDSPPWGLPSFFGTMILNQEIGDVAEIFANYGEE